MPLIEVISTDGGATELTTSPETRADDGRADDRGNGPGTGGAAARAVVPDVDERELQATIPIPRHPAPIRRLMLDVRRAAVASAAAAPSSWSSDRPLSDHHRDGAAGLEQVGRPPLSLVEALDELEAHLLLLPSAGDDGDVFVDRDRSREGGSSDGGGDDGMYDVAASLIRLPLVGDGRGGGGDGDGRVDDDTIRGRLDRCLDLCGPSNAFVAAMDCLRDAAAPAAKEEGGGSAIGVAGIPPPGNFHTLAGADDNAPSSNGGVSAELGPSSVLTAIRTARRLLLTLPGYDDDDEQEECGAAAPPLLPLTMDYAAAFLLIPPPNKEEGPNRTRQGTGGSDLSPHAMHDLARLAVLLPVRIGAACHAVHLTMPSWTVRDRYCPRLVECALLSAAAAAAVARSGPAGAPSPSSAAYVFLQCLVDKMVQHGGSDSVVLGMYKFWTRLRGNGEGSRSHGTARTGRPNPDKFSDVVPGALRSMQSPRDVANVLRSQVQFCASRLGPNEIRTMRRRSRTSSSSSEEEIWGYEPMVFLRESSLPTLRTLESGRDAFFRLVVMSPPATSSSSADSVDDDARLLVVPRIAVSLFALCDHDGESTDLEEKGESESVLMHYFQEASESWSEPLFVSRTDESRQLHITEFILSSIPFLEKDGINGAIQQSIVMSLVKGVTARLDSSLGNLRRHGMLVAEAMAPLLGQTLRFKELDGAREGDNDEMQAEENEIEARNGGAAAPSTEHADSKEDSGANSDDDSIWDEDDLKPYDLDDDEEDLKETPRPRYLRTCLALLRSPENDNDAFNKTEAALKEIASLVRAEPPDLPDLAAPLARQLLFMEDKYDLNEFVSLRWDGLCALLVLQPMTVSKLFAEEIFGSISLSIRLDILGLYEHAAEELCGSAALKNERDARKARLRDGALVDHSKVSGKRRLVQDQKGAEKAIELCTDPTVGLIESKTRRWGKGRHRREEKTVTNRFGPIAPMMFYPLIAGFVRTKSDKAIWGGPNGARLMASFLVALARLVESSGNYAGTAVLASDLFELSWPFRNADGPEVRMAVLIAIATCLSYLPLEFFAGNLFEDESLTNFLHQEITSDSDATCRQVAAVIAKNLEKANVMSLPGIGTDFDFGIVEKSTTKR